MATNSRLGRWLYRTVMASLLLGTLALVLRAGDAKADFLSRWRERRACGSCDQTSADDTLGGSWYWMRSPEQEKRVVMGLYNRYCVRCHGDGRGIWDIPDVPDFTNATWHAYRTEGRLARAIIEGRGSVMPPFRGTLTLEEAYAMARYLRSFVPGTEVSKPDIGKGSKGAGGK